VISTGIQENELKSLYPSDKFSIWLCKEEMRLGMTNCEAIFQLTLVIVNSELGISDLISRFGFGFVEPEVDPMLIGPIAIVKHIIEDKSENTYIYLQDKLLLISEKYT
jgi:hypothetical protein